jgi:hypothetical protein
MNSQHELNGGRWNVWCVVFCVAMVATSAHAQRPSIAGLQQELGALGSDLLVCPSSSPTRFVDNGDGTICDHQTGLMWEQKDASDSAQDLTNPHDVDNQYTWSTTGSGATGTVFTDFLPRLNGEIADSELSNQLGGHSDWRLPTSAELLTIRNCIDFIFTCIDPIFSPNFTGLYWSSTSLSGTNHAWYVLFNDFNPFIANTQDKGLTENVRAVRGGR